MTRGGDVNNATFDVIYTLIVLMLRLYVHLRRCVNWKAALNKSATCTFTTSLVNTHFNLTTSFFISLLILDTCLLQWNMDKDREKKLSRLSAVKLGKFRITPIKSQIDQRIHDKSTQNSSPLYCFGYQRNY